MSIMLAAAGCMAASQVSVILQRVQINKFGSPTLTGTLSFSSAGTASFDGDKATSWEWLKQGNASDYYVRLTKDSGTDPAVGSLNTDYNLGSGVSWQWENAAVGFPVSFDGTLNAYRVGGGGNVIATCSVSVNLQT